ncbi:hypothetical protein [Neobacillus sp. YIM B06451]|uniref:hypothetical protein n=1 Tax=Neobacillus sp. YIM B06451 TaxID=3070994 RepID=UPI00293025B6|nr:hypothetical protein [Neobacillus sp. YIM B06451]
MSRKLFVIVALFLLLSGCSQGKVVEEAEDGISKAEKLNEKLKVELDYNKRVETLSEKAYSVPDEILFSEVQTAYEKGGKLIKEVKDKDKVAEFQKRLDKVNIVLTEAETILLAVKEGYKLNQSADEFRSFLTANPLSMDLESKFVEFKSLTEKKATVMSSLPTGWKEGFGKNVIKDDVTLIGGVENSLTLNEEISTLANLIGKKATSKEIDVKIKEIEQILSAISIKEVNTALTNNLNAVKKPYLDRLAEEKRVAEAKAKSEAKAKAEAEVEAKLVASNSTGTGSKSATGTGSKPSSGSKTPSTPASKPTSGSTTSGGSGGSSGGITPSNPWGNNALYQKVAPVCSKYGYNVEMPAPTVAACSNGGRFPVDIAMAGTVSSEVSGEYKVVVDVAIALGVPLSRNELMAMAEDALSKPRNGSNKNGVRVYGDKGHHLSITW